jgi:hypothetical protein
MLKSPLIYFPTTTCFIDDDPLYPKTLGLRLNLNHWLPLESSELVWAQKDCDLLFSNPAEHGCDFGLFEHFEKNLAVMQRSANLISVVVADLNMGERSGIDIFYGLTSPYIGRILASMFLDYPDNSAVRLALNQGAIHYALDKAKQFNEEFPKALARAKIEFFTKLSNSLYAQRLDNHPFLDTEFSKVFNSLILELNPKEIQSNPTFSRFTLLFGGDRPDKVFTVASREDMRSQLESLSAQSAPSSVLSGIERGTHILCPKGNDDTLPDGDTWPLLIRPAKSFTGRNTSYFYNFSED